MRAGVSTVQQTLTAEAATILKQAVAEACKRGHAQATPLHVAATLLVAPSSPLRRACLQTHPHSSHLPQCRALELCFNIALERLQAAQGPLPGGQPSYSNALVAALKRAQAHQRRGCPEQQQQPLLAVKVELEQLVISILDDPSVSRVMREAGFNSTDVKSHLEEVVSLMATHHSVTHSVADAVRLPLGAAAIDQMGFRLGGTPSILGGFALPHHLSTYNSGGVSQERSDIQLHIRPLRTQSPYMNPVLLKPGGTELLLGVGEDSKRVLDVLMRKKRRNPVLLGDSAARVDGIIRDVMQHLERGDVPEQLQGVKVVSAKLSFMTLISASKEDLHARFVELNNSVQELMPAGGAIVNLGDLQWLLPLRTSASRLAGFCPLQHAAYEIRELLAQHQDSGRIWLIGTASNLTYRNCQVLYPSLENQWELQPVPVGASGQSSLSARCRMQEAGINSTDSSLTLSLLPAPVTALKLSSLDAEGREQLICCSDCMAKYEKEALLLHEQEGGGQSDSPQSCSSSVETPNKGPPVDQHTQSASVIQPVLPLWLQKALPNGSTNITASVASSVEAKDKILPLAQRLQELQKKWNLTCQTLHVERVPCLNVSLETWQQPSPSSSQISGGTSGRCQERAFSLLRDNSTGPGSARPTVGLYPAMNGNHPPRVIASSLPIFILQNGPSDHHLQVSAHKERVQEDSTCCSLSKVRLPWQAPPAGAPIMPSTEAAAPCFASDSEQRGHPPGMFQRMDLDALSQLCKGLIKRVGWQPGVISTIANTVMQCRSGLGKRRGVSFKGDSWLLFLGYDRPGKRQMAEALAELIFGEEKKPICLTFGRQQDLSSPSAWSLGLTVPYRRKMPLDQLAEAVRHNSSSVVLLEDLEQADSMFRSSLLRAMEKGRLVDSSGRDVSFKDVIVVITSSIGTDSSEPKCTGLHMQTAKKSSTSDSIVRLYSGMEDSGCCADNGHLENAPEQQSSSCKRKGDWDADDESKVKMLGCQNKKCNLGWALDLDLNMSAEENDKADSSTAAYKSCEVEGNIRAELNEEEVLSSARKHLQEFCDLVDAAVVFGSPL